MPKRSAAESIPALHALYCAESGHKISLDAGRERDWFEWLRRIDNGDINPETALTCVINHIRRGIREQRRNPGALKFRNLIGNADWFEEDLAEARATLRNTRPHSNRSEALKSAGHTDGRAKDDPKPPEVRTAQQVIETQAFKDMIKMKESLGPRLKAEG